MRIPEKKFNLLTDQIARRLISSLPDDLRSRTGNLIFVSADRPSDSQIDDDDEREELLGLYEGIPLNERSVSDDYSGPDVITLFRVNLADMCDTEKELRDEIRLTIIHELGHFFGFDENALEKMGFG